jgi:hypothetical protein
MVRTVRQKVGKPMKFDSMNAEPMGTLIHDGKHKPFHALACPLNPQVKPVKKRAWES